MVDITKMKRMEGESEQAFWERKVIADGDIILTDQIAAGHQRPGESRAEYEARFHAAALPLSHRGANCVVSIMHREGESHEEYRERHRAASPPLSEDQKEVIRAAGREYWAIVAQRERDRRNIDG